MRSITPVNIRGRSYWDEINMPAAEYAARLERLRAMLEKEGLAAMLVYSKGHEDGSFFYYTNLINYIPKYGKVLVVTRDDTVIYHGRSSRSGPILSEHTWVEDIRFPERLSTAVAAHVGELESSSTDIGVVGLAELPHGLRCQLEESLADCELRSFDRALVDLRRKKSIFERNQVKRASRILVEVYQRVIDKGTHETELDLERRFDRCARLLGAQDVATLIANPGCTEWQLRQPEDYELDLEQPVAVNLAVRFEGYWAEMGRIINPHTRGVASGTIDELDTNLRTVVDSIEPGVAFIEIQSRLLEAAQDLGFHVPPHHPLGNHIGASLREPPFLDEELTVEEDTTMVIRQPLLSQDDRLVLVGDTVEITSNGTAFLTR